MYIRLYQNAISTTKVMHHQSSHFHLKIYGITLAIN